MGIFVAVVVGGTFGHLLIVGGRGARECLPPSLPLPSPPLASAPQFRLPRLLLYKLLFNCGAEHFAGQNYKSVAGAFVTREEAAAHAT